MKTKKMPKISVIFPCRNEEKILPPILTKLPRFISQTIVVDNLSSDNTAKIAKKLGASVYYEKRQINGIGYGYAIQTGISKAKGKYIVLMDGDKTYPMKYIKKIVDFMEKNNVDFVSCKRFPLANWRHMSPIRYLGGKALTLAANLLFQTQIEDILSGMWVFKKEIIPDLNIKPGDWNLSLSIKLSAALANNISFIEYHIPYQDRKVGASKQKLLASGLSHLFYLLKLKYYFIITPAYQTKRIYF